MNSKQNTGKTARTKTKSKPKIKTFIVAALAFATIGSAEAQGNNVTVKSGGGETLEMKSGWFGRDSIKVQDRFGNKLENSKGWLSRKKEIKVLGNSVEEKKGLFGQKSYKATSILGDKIETKRTWLGLGPRKTTVDLSGVSSIANQLIKKKQTASNSDYTPKQTD
jgi:hypothetical protein